MRRREAREKREKRERETRRHAPLKKKSRIPVTVAAFDKGRAESL